MILSELLVSVLLKSKLGHKFLRYPRPLTIVGSAAVGYVFAAVVRS